MSIYGKNPYLRVLHSVVLFIADFVTILFCLRAGHWLWVLSPFRVHPEPPPFSWISHSATAFLFVLVLIYGNTYRIRNSIVHLLKIRDLIRAIILGYGLILILGFYARSLFIGRLFAFYTFFLLFVLILLERYLIDKLWAGMIRKIEGRKRVLIYGAGETGVRLAKAVIRQPKLGYEVIGFLDDEKQKGEKVLNGSLEVMGGLKKEPFMISRERANEVWLAMPSASTEYQTQVLDACNVAGVPYRFVPSLNELALHRVRMEDLGGIPLFGVKSLRMRPFNKVVKRSFDILFSVCILILSAPLMGLFYILIKKDSPGPAIFAQKRVGLAGRVFMMYKFRSMYQDAEPYAVNPLKKDDPRITKIGRYLRRTSLDELPQFWNVLKGEMSVVGPRPEMPFIVDTYNDIHKERLNVKPGITGLWQISGDRAFPIHENVDHDLFYIEHQSFLLDLIIVFETFVFALRGIGAH
jgi:exopolysaccharide biosynthesis polyprenyl glycosylphosphotransferase